MLEKTSSIFNMYFLRNVISENIPDYLMEKPYKVEIKSIQNMNVIVGIIYSGFSFNGIY